MPRLTTRVFADLAVWMTGFGLAIGLIFPPFCLLLGLPASGVTPPSSFASTLAAGLVGGVVNFALSRLVVGRRLRVLAERMSTVERQLAAAVYSQDWSGCDPEQCAIPVDSDDEAGASAAGTGPVRPIRATRSRSPRSCCASAQSSARRSSRSSCGRWRCSSCSA